MNTRSHSGLSLLRKITVPPGRAFPPAGSGAHFAVSAQGRFHRVRPSLLRAERVLFPFVACTNHYMQLT